MAAPMWRNPMPQRAPSQRINMNLPPRLRQPAPVQWRPVVQTPVLEWRRVAPPPLPMPQWPPKNNNPVYNKPIAVPQPMFRNPPTNVAPKPIQKPQPVQPKPVPPPPNQPPAHKTADLKSIQISFTNEFAKMSIKPPSAPAPQVISPPRTQHPRIKAPTPSPPAANRPTGDPSNPPAERRENRSRRKACFTKPNTQHISPLLLQKIPEKPK